MQSQQTYAKRVQQAGERFYILLYIYRAGLRAEEFWDGLLHCCLTLTWALSHRESFPAAGGSSPQSAEKESGEGGLPIPVLFSARPTRNPWRTSDVHQENSSLLVA